MEIELVMELELENEVDIRGIADRMSCIFWGGGQVS